MQNLAKSCPSPKFGSYVAQPFCVGLQICSSVCYANIQTDLNSGVVFLEITWNIKHCNLLKHGPDPVTRKGNIKYERFLILK